MAQPIHITTRVLPGGRIEVTVSELQEGQEVEVLITIQPVHNVAIRDEAHGTEQLHVLDVIAGIPPQRNFQTAEDVEHYLQEERDSW